MEDDRQLLDAGTESEMKAHKSNNARSLFVSAVCVTPGNTPNCR